MTGPCVLEESHISGAGVLAQQAEELGTLALQSELNPKDSRWTQRTDS